MASIIPPVKKMFWYCKYFPAFAYLKYAYALLQQDRVALHPAKFDIHLTSTTIFNDMTIASSILSVWIAYHKWSNMYEKARWKLPRAVKQRTCYHARDNNAFQS